MLQLEYRQTDDTSKHGIHNTRRSAIHPQGRRPILPGRNDENFLTKSHRLRWLFLCLSPALAGRLFCPSHFNTLKCQSGHFSSLSLRAIFLFNFHTEERFSSKRSTHLPITNLSIPQLPRSQIFQPSTASQTKFMVFICFTVNQIFHNYLSSSYGSGNGIQAMTLSALHQ